MRTFRELCSDQREIQKGVHKILEPLRKYGANRTIPLVTKRTTEVKQLWNDYQTYHQHFFDHLERDDRAEYFVNSEYTSTELLIQSTLKKLDSYYQELSTDESQRTAAAQAKEAEKAKEAERLAKESERKTELEEKAIRDAKLKEKLEAAQQSHLSGKIKLLNIRYQ